MNTALLALEQTPPLSVPLRFFLTAPLFGLLASLLLFYDAPLFFSIRWSSYTLALTHLITLGFITMVMFGAMMQLLPVLTGSRVPRPVFVSTLLHILLTLGSLGLAVSFIFKQSWLILGTLVLLSLAFFGFIGIVGYCLISVKGRSPIITAMRLAIIALFVVSGLGILLVMFLNSNIALPHPIMLTNLHLTWGLVGWVALLMMGIAYQVVPMFQITPHYPPALTRWLIPLLFSLLVLWTFILISFKQLSSLVPQFLLGFMGLGISLFALVTLQLQLQRLRKLPDVTLNYWRVGMVGLLLSVLFWLSGLLWSDLGKQPFYPILLGVLFIAGFVLSVIQGMLYKIIPFLIWLHLQNQQLNILNPLKMIKTPNMKQVIPDSHAHFQFWVYMIALIALIGTVLQPPYLGNSAGLLLFGSFLGLTYNLYRAWWLYLKVSRKIRQNSITT